MSVHMNMLRTPRRMALLAVCAVMLALLAGTGTSPAEAAGDTYSGHERSRSFNKDWRFALVNSADTTDPTGAYAEAASVGYDDSAWRTLDVPHDWSIELPRTNVAGAGTDAGSGWAPGGPGWYRRTFTLPKSMTGKRISLEFDGVAIQQPASLPGTTTITVPSEDGTKTQTYSAGLGRPSRPAVPPVSGARVPA
ncbi:sugar-binding domain-containing protein [Nonomuraea sp. NPDC049480]|uniref:sugar-binding domain-containing protein n=1 Tax=Nonomuraea sp. NPDC049480 TaxID=3364353 RepID=UPI0037B9E449